VNKISPSNANSILNLPINILFQSRELLVVDKPVGISIHNHDSDENLISLLGQQFPNLKLFPVHRLDKETSGVQIFALDEKAAAQVASIFQNRQLQKKYIGVLRGQLKDDEGTWKQSLTDKAEGRKNPAGMAKDRVDCETKYKVLKKNSFFTLCEFDLITGRQHQIRKHTALCNHPLVGDPRYSDPKYNQKIFKIYSTERMFLHCERLELDSDQLKFKADLPEDFMKLMGN